MFEEGEESALVEAIVGAQDLSVWATLMPAVYQLVPGSMIAKLWFSIIYPPELAVVEGSYVLQNNVFSDLMVPTRVELNRVIFTPSATSARHFQGSILTSARQFPRHPRDVGSTTQVTATSLALGLILGFVVVARWCLVFLLALFLWLRAVAPRHGRS